MPQTGKIPVSAPVRTADDHDRHACIRSSHTPALSISSIALNRTDPLHPKVWARFECAGSCMPRHAPHAGWEAHRLPHSRIFAQMYARTCISRQMPGGTIVMQLHPPDYAGHDIRKRAECHGVMPVSGAFRRIVYATAYRTVRGVKRRLNPALHGRTHVIQWPEPRIQQRYHSAVRDTGHWTRPAAGISHIQRLLQSPFIFHRWCRRRAYR